MNTEMKEVKQLDLFPSVDRNEITIGWTDGSLVHSVADVHGIGSDAWNVARLYQAAPELLAALEAMLRVALKCDDKAWAMAVGRSDETRPCDMAMEAIARARGKQH